MKNTIVLLSIFMFFVFSAVPSEANRASSNPCDPIEVRGSSSGTSSQGSKPNSNTNDECDEQYGYPSGPVELSSLVLSDKRARFTWDPEESSSHGDGFQHSIALYDKHFQVRSDALGIEIDVFDMGTTTTANPLPNGSHEFELFGCNRSGTAPTDLLCEYFGSATVTINPPEPTITNVFAELVDAGGGGIQVSWSEEDLDASSIANVQVEKCSLAEGGNCESLSFCYEDAGTMHTNSQQGFANCSSPNVGDTACCGVVEAHYSYQFTVTNGQASPKQSNRIDMAAPPSRVRNIRFSPSSALSENGSATLHWDAPTVGHATYYRVQAKMVGTNATVTDPALLPGWSDAVCTNGTANQVSQTNCTLSILDNGTVLNGDWFFRINAYNNTTTESSGAEYSGRLHVLEKPPHVGTLSTIQGSGALEEQVTVSWVGTSGTTEDYQIHELPTANSTPPQSGGVQSSVSKTFSNIDGSPMHFAVRSCNELDRCSDWSTKTFTPEFEIPSSPSGLSLITEEHIQSPRFDWQSTTHADHYLATLNGASISAINSGELGSSVWNNVPQVPYGSYTLSVRACNDLPNAGDRCSDPANLVVNLAALPEIVSDVEAFRFPGTGQVQVSWNEENLDVSSIASVTVEKCSLTGNGSCESLSFCYEDAGTMHTDVQQGFTSCPDVANGDRLCCGVVEAHHSYQFTVTNGSSGPVQSSVVEVAAAPSHVRNIGFIPANAFSEDGHATLTWSAPLLGDATRYQVEAKMVSTNFSVVDPAQLTGWASVVCTNGSNNEVTQTQCDLILKNGNNVQNGDWFFRVFAYNDTTTDSSGAAYSGRLQVLESPPNVGSLNFALGTGNNENKVTLNWSATSGTTVGYQVFGPYTAGTALPGTASISHSSPNATASLISESQNLFAVRACNTLNRCSDWSQSTFTPNFFTPLPPSGVSQTSDQSDPTPSFDWTAVSGADKYKINFAGSSYAASNNTWTYSGNPLAVGTYSISVQACNEIPTFEDRCSTATTMNDVHIVGDVPVVTGVSVVYDGADGNEQDFIKFVWNSSVSADNGYAVQARWHEINPDGSLVSDGNWSAPDWYCTDLPYEVEPILDVGYLGSETRECVAPGERDRIYEVTVYAYYPGNFESGSNSGVMLLVPPSFPADVGPLSQETNNGSATITWDASTGSVARYKVESRRKNVDTAFTSAIEFSDQICVEGLSGNANYVTGIQCTISGLDDGDWQFRVTAQNGPFENPMDETESLPISNSQYHVRMLQAPGQPLFAGYTFNDVAGDNSHSMGSYRVAWQRPNDDARVIGYEVKEYFKLLGASAFPNIETQTYTVDDGSTTHLDFSPSSRQTGNYFYEVRAINEVNPASANPSLETSAFKIVKAIPAPMGMEALHEGISIDGMFDVAWDAIVEPPVASGFDLDVRYQFFVCQTQIEGGSCTNYQEVNSFDGPGLIRSLTSAQMSSDAYYYFKTRAHYEGNFSTQSLASDPVRVLYTPGVVNSVEVDQHVTGDEADFVLNWQNPTGSVERYEFQYSAAGVEHSDYQGVVEIDPSQVSQNDATSVLTVPMISVEMHAFELRACNVGSCGNPIEFSATPIHEAPSSVQIVALTPMDNDTEVVLQLNYDESLTDYLLVAAFQNNELVTNYLEVSPRENVHFDLPGAGDFEIEVQACNSLLGMRQCIADTIDHTVDLSEAWASKGVVVPNSVTAPFVAPTHDATVGALAGEGGADGGSAYYNIPISVVPGRNGMQPSVSLSYSSRGGNGLLGVGWSLSASQSISRCGTSVVHDGYSRAYQYDSKDRLCLNGQRLLLEGGVGVYGAEGSVYRTEDSSLMRVEQTGTLNADADTGPVFTVRYKNGHVAKFGETLNARHSAEGRTEAMSWAISRQNDPSGNAIHYYYQKFGSGEYLLSEIKYTGVGNTPGNRSIAFDYEPRQSFDLQSSYHADGQTQLTQKLSSIQTAINESAESSSAVRTYRLHYGDLSQYSRRTLLRSIEECGYEADGAEVCRPGTEFDWSETEQQYVFEPLQYVAADGMRKKIGINEHKITSVIPHSDENGDGVGDFPGVYINAEGEYIGDREYENLETCVRPFGSFNDECHSADFNNDGLTDHFEGIKIGNEYETVRITYTSPDGNGSLDGSPTFVDTPVPFSAGKTGIVTVQDLNSDGWVDFAVRANLGGGNDYRLYFYLHTGNPQSPYTEVAVDDDVLDYDYDSNEFKYNANVGFIGDLNGDGTTDFVEYNNDRSIQANQNKADTPENIHFVNSEPDGGVSTTVVPFSTFIGGDHELDTSMGGDQVLSPIHGWENSHVFMDVNGDGLTDWLSVFGKLPTPVAHNAQHESGETHTVYTSNAPLSVRLNTGAGFKSGWHQLPIAVQMTTRWQPFATNIDNGNGFPMYSMISSNIITADYNGDGRQDILKAGAPIAEGCARFKAYGGDITGESVDGVAEWYTACGDAIYAAVNLNQDNNDNVGSSFIGEHRDVSVRRYTAHMFRSTSNGGVAVTSAPTSIYASGGNRVAADIFGDGLNDVLTTIGCDINDTEYCDLNSPYQSSPIDEAFNGNGAIVGAYIMRNRGAANNENERYRAPDMLERVTDGLGMEYHWEYRPLTSGEFSIDEDRPFYQVDHNYLNGGAVSGVGAEAFEYHHFGSSLYVVAQHRTSHGGTFDHDGDGVFDDEPNNYANKYNEYRYRYSGATYHKMGRGFLGFRSIVAEDYSKQVKTLTVFDQIWPYTGNILKTCSWELDELDGFTTTSAGDTYDIGCEGVPFSEQTLTYERYQIKDGSEVSVPKTKETLTRDLTARSFTMNTSTVTHEYYPDYGNLRLQTIVNVDTGIGTSTTTEEHTYYPVDAGASWFDKLDTTTVTRSAVSGRQYLDDVVQNAGLDAVKTTTTSYTWDSDHRKPKTVSVSGGTTTTSTYTPRGQVSSVKVRVDALGDERISYSDYMADAYFPHQSRNALLHPTTIETDERFGAAKHVTDANGVQAITRFDPFGLPIESETLVPGSGQSIPISYTALSSCVVETDCAPGAVIRTRQAQAGAPLTMVDVDLAGRTVRTLKEGPSDLVYADHVVTLAQYDRNGYARFESVPHFIGDIDQSKVGVRYTSYDTLGRLLAKSVDQATAGRFETTYSYLGWLTTIYADDLVLKRMYDSQNRLIKTIDALEGETTYAYDGSGSPIVIQDANQNSIIAQYDSLNRKLWVDDPNAGRTDFTYNLLGELTSKIDAEDILIESSYDSLGRAIERHVTNPDPAVNGGARELDARWYYDEHGGELYRGALIQEEKYGSSDVTPVMSKRYAFDAFGRVTNTTHTIDTVSYHTGVTYDANYGRPLAMHYPNDLTVTTEYTSNGYPYRDVNAASGYVYRRFDMVDEWGNPTSVMLGNETIAETQGFHRNTGQMAFINVTANGQLRHHIDYDEYDVFGNVTRQIKHYPDEQARETFTYDELHRLTSSVRSIVVPDVSGGISLPDLTGTVGSSSGGSNGGATNDKPTSFRVNYRYDAVGNLTHKSDFGHIYAYGNDTTGEGADCYGGPNAVMYIAKTRGAPALYCYDKRGNQISGDGRNITYNAFNHPTNISENTNNSMSSFAYGADLQRYRQIHTEGNQTTYTYYIDKLSEIKQVGSEVEVRNYIADYAVVTEKLTGTLVDNSLENLTTSGYTMSYLHKDRLGSVATITDETGAIKERRGFDPFGKPRKGSWEDKPLPIIGSDLTDRGFTGHEHLDSSQLIHMNGRIYDYNSGRFLSVDPLIQAPGNSQSMNPYSYIMNNPLAGIDPTGYASVTVTRDKVAQTGSRIPRHDVTTVTVDGHSVTLEGSFTDEQIVEGLNEADKQLSNGAGSNSSSKAQVAGAALLSTAASEAPVPGSGSKPSSTGKLSKHDLEVIDGGKGKTETKTKKKLSRLLKVGGPIGAAISILTMDTLNAGENEWVERTELFEDFDALIAMRAHSTDDDTKRRRREDIWLHYTTEEGFNAIINSVPVKIRKNSDGVVFLTKSLVPLEDVSNTLFAGFNNNPRTHVIAFTLQQGVSIHSSGPGVSQKNEFVHHGTMRVPRQIRHIVYAGKVPFQ